MKDSFSDSQKRRCPPGLRDQMTCHSKRKGAVVKDETTSWIWFWLLTLAVVFLTWVNVLIKG